MRLFWFIGGRGCFHARIWDVFGNLCEGGYVRAAFSFLRGPKVSEIPFRASGMSESSPASA